MKKYFSLAAGAAMMLGTAIGMALPANAQTAAGTTGAASGPFADVPADHWAYQAVNTLQKAGIVIGYPDGTYGGRRAMTRYEFAVAIARLLPMIQQQPTDYVKTSDFEAFQNDVNNRLQQQQAAIDALRALVNEFQGELTQLGQDVDAIKHRLDADEARLAVVEEEQRRLKITGEANFIVTDGINLSKTDNDPIDENGYRIGTQGNRDFFNNINVYHDILLDFDGRVSDNAHLVVKIDAGNYLSHLGSYDSADPFRNDNTEPSTDTFSIYQAYLDAPVSLGNGFSGGELVVGRFGNQLTPFTLKAVDPDVYTNLPETDSGDVDFDGAKLMFGVFGTHIQLFAGKNSPIDNQIVTGGPNIQAKDGFHRPGSESLTGDGGQQYYTTIDQSAGARVAVGNIGGFNVGLNGLIARTTQTAVQTLAGQTITTTPVDPYYPVPYNSLLVYSADFQGTLPFLKKEGITLDGEFANSATGQNTRLARVNGTHGTEAYYAELGYSFGPFSIKGGWRQVYNNFAAPGFWDQVGDYINPSNVRGPIAHLQYTITPTLSLVADGKWYRGIYNVGDQSPLGSHDTLHAYDAGLKYGLSSSYGVDLGYQYVEWNLANDQGLLNAAGKPTEQYITIGVGHSLSQNASLKLLYQIIEYKDKGTGFDPAGDSHGGVAVTQFSVKF